MSNVSDETTNTLHYTISRVSEIVLDTFIFILASSYMIFALMGKTFRSNKLNWPTLNIILTTALFAIIHGIFTTTHLDNFPSVSCHLRGFLIAMAACHMMYAYCTSAFTRLLFIRYFNKPIFRSHRWLLMNIIICWLVGLLFAIPHLFYDNFACAYNKTLLFFKVYTCMTAVILPVLIVALCNISIFRYIHQIRRRIHNANNNKTTHNISSKRDLRLSKLMLLTFSFFLIGWTPMLLQSLFITIDHDIVPIVSLLFEILLPTSLLGQMILLIYANRPMCQFLKRKLTCNERFLFFIKLS